MQPCIKHHITWYKYISCHQESRWEFHKDEKCHDIKENIQSARGYESNLSYTKITLKNLLDNFTFLLPNNLISFNPQNKIYLIIINKESNKDYEIHSSM